MSQLLQIVARVENIAALRANLFPAATSFFGARRGALFAFEEMTDAARFQQGAFAKALRERHAPLHEGQIIGARQWQATHSRADHGHALAGPIVRGGELVGVLAFTRATDDAGFDEGDVSALSALCLHVSTRMASWNDEKTDSFALTPREREIVALVARGQTNAQIGRALFVSSETVKAHLKTLFRKTNVASRAQLVSVLGASGSGLIK